MEEISANNICEFGKRKYISIYYFKRLVRDRITDQASNLYRIPSSKRVEKGPIKNSCSKTFYILNKNHDMVFDVLYQINLFIYAE